MIDEAVLLLDSVKQLLAARAGGDPDRAEPWRGLVDNGYLSVGTPDGDGDLETAAHVVRVCAGFVDTTDLPVGLQALVVPWLRHQTGLAGSNDPSTVATVPAPLIEPAGRDRLVSAVADRVPWAAASRSILLIIDDVGGAGRVVQIDPDDDGVRVDADPVRVVCATGRVSANRARVDGDRVRQLSEPILRELRLRQHLAVTMQLAGLLDGVLALCTGYVRDRRQFGKAIGDFQMVKSTIALLAEEVTLANVAAAAAAATANASVRDAAIEVHAARAFTAQAATRGSRLAHQIHGAIGMTAEYPLHRFTRSLWHLCDHNYPATRQAAELGRLVTVRGGRSMWSALVGEKPL